MAGPRYYTFDGQYQRSVLGTFRLIRGFANLQDLAAISVPYEMIDGDELGRVQGQQRQLDEVHAERIKRYLENGEQRFLPEVILSVRAPLMDELDASQKPIGVTSDTADGISIRRPWKSKNIRVHRMTVERKRISEIREKKLIRRVDGNHRLALAGTLADDPSVPTKYLAPFCLILLGPPGEEADDYSESLVFHTINSTALPLESEHALRLILGQGEDYDMTPEREFAFSPDLHFTRLLRDGLLQLTEPARSRLGPRPLTSLRGAVRGILEMAPDVAKDLTSLKTYSSDLLSALSDIITRLQPIHPALCASNIFIELAARVWHVAEPIENFGKRVDASVQYLEHLARWLGKEGLEQLSEGVSLSKQVLDIYAAVRARVPRRVFLARWYPQPADGEDVGKASLRLEQVRQALAQVQAEEGTHLELIDMGTQAGSTFPIHQSMYEAIASSDIILVDLSGVRPNVCVEAGFALRHHDKQRLVFMFQPTAGHLTVPFDLNDYRYEPFNDTGEIPGKIKPQIIEILRKAKIGG